MVRIRGSFAEIPSWRPEQYLPLSTGAVGLIGGPDDAGLRRPVICSARTNCCAGGLLWLIARKVEAGRLVDSCWKPVLFL